MDQLRLQQFLLESNKIERITKNLSKDELDAAQSFLALDEITIPDLEAFVAVFQPDAKVRQFPGMDVQVGRHIPRPGSVIVETILMDIVADATIMRKAGNNLWKDSYLIHQRYESLHPFTDCNGRSGRILWLWMMEDTFEFSQLGFLHTWYYQSLEESR